MTQETAILRLDFNREPPGYMVGAAGDFQSEGYCWWSTSTILCSAAGFTEPEIALTAAWVDYKARRNPPGIAVDAWGFGQRSEGWWCNVNLDANITGARVAAWAWHDRRLVLAAQLRATAGVVVEHFHDDVPPRCTVVPDALLATYLGRADVLGGDDYAEGTATELMERGVMQFEGDPPIMREQLEVWPSILIWSSDQVAGVERWLIDATAEMPEVLGG